jgi:branched-chain amino acid transport system substrate-binding protein
LFEKKCRELGIEVLAHTSIIPKQSNYKAVIQKVKATNPDLLYFGGTTQSSGPQIVIDMKGEGLNCPVMVPDGCYEQNFIKGAGADTLNAVTCYATIGGYDPGQMLEAGGSGAEFVKKYQAKYGNMPEAYAVYGYEAAKVVLEAIKKVGGKDREAIRKAVMETKNFTAGALREKGEDGSATSGWSFDEDGDTTIKVLTISKIEGGAFKPQKTITE